MTSELADRLFLAVSLTDDARVALRERLRDALPRGLPGRTVRPESWHLTLRFLGDTPAAAAAAVRSEMRHAPLGPSFSLRFGQLGAFPRPDRARVLWLGVEEGATELRELAARVEAAVRRAGLPAERRPFAAHLTLSRLRAPEDLRPLLAHVPPIPEPLAVADVILYRSHLGGGPARYEVVERFGLGEG